MKTPVKKPTSSGRGAVSDFDRDRSGLIVMLGLTYRCQCSCSPCGMGIYKKNRRGEFTTGEWLKVIDSLPADTKHVFFFGGEPTLRSDLPELIRRVKKRGLQAHMDTNGYLLTPALVGKLKRAGLDAVFVSLDSSDPATHDRLRGRAGIFARAVAGIKSCLRAGLPCGVSSYATKQNLKDGGLKRTIGLAEGLKVNFMRILPPVLSGKWLKAENLRLDDTERKILKSLIRKDFSFLEDEYCSALNKKLFYVSPYGDVQPCCYVPFSFGNIKDTPLQDILKKVWGHPLYGIKSKECIMNNREFREKYLKKIDLSLDFPVAQV